MSNVLFLISYFLFLLCLYPFSWQGDGDRRAHAGRALKTQAVRLSAIKADPLMNVPKAEAALFLLIDPVLQQFKTFTVHSDPVIPDLQQDTAALSSTGDRDQAASSAVFDAVIERIFNERL